jgi:hypothetical protein
MKAVVRLLLTLLLLVANSWFVDVTAADADFGSHRTFGENKGADSFTADIATNEQGVLVEVQGRQTTPDVAGIEAITVASPAQVTVSTTASGPVYRLQPVNIGNASRTWFEDGRRAHPDSVPMSLSVDGIYQRIVWIPYGTNPGGQSPAPTVDPRDVAIEMVRQIPLPEVQVQMNPALGLVGMPGWFWAEGYDGHPLSDAVTVSVPGGNAFTVAVRLRPQNYEWDFGDGTSLVTESFGKAYPDVSDVQHTYEYSSLDFPDGFPVRVTTEFLAEFSVDGGVFQPLPLIRRTYENRFRVQEVQPVLTGS